MSVDEVIEFCYKYQCTLKEFRENQEHSYNLIYSAFTLISINQLLK